MFLILIRFSDENAVSVAEKYADIITQNMIIVSDVLSLSIKILPKIIDYKAGVRLKAS